MVVGVVDHQHGTRDLRRLPRPAPGGGVTWSVAAIAAGVDGRRAAAVRVRRQGGRPGDRSSTRARAARRRSSALTARVGAHRRLQPAVRRRDHRTAGRPDDGRRRRRRATARRCRPFVAPAVLLTAVTVVARRRPRPGRRRRHRRPPAPRRHGRATSTSRCGTASPSSCCCRPWPSPVAPCCTSPGDRVGRVLALGRFVPPSSGAYLGALRGVNTRRQPRHGRRPARLAAALPRRHPAHRSRSCPACCCCPGRGGPAGRSSSTSRRTSRSPPSSSASPSPRRSSAAASPVRCSSAWSATRWPRCSWSRAPRTSPSPRSPSRPSRRSCSCSSCAGCPTASRRRRGAARRAVRIVIATVVGARRVRLHARRRRASSRRPTCPT